VNLGHSHTHQWTLIPQIHQGCALGQKVAARPQCTDGVHQKGCHPIKQNGPKVLNIF